MRWRAILKLFLVGFSVWLLAYRILSKSALEHALYDYQQRVRVLIAGPPLLPEEVIPAAIDPAAYEAGLRESDLPRIREKLGYRHAVVVSKQGLGKYLEPDSDGTLRGVKLYESRTPPLGISPPLGQLMVLQGAFGGNPMIENDRIRLPGRNIQTDSEGRIYPRFPLTDYYSFAAKGGFWQGLLRPSKSDTMLTIRALTPISIPDLFRKGVKTDGKIVLLGMYLPVSEKVEFHTPGGDMVRLELYASILGSLISGDYCLPLSSSYDTLLSLAFLFLLAALLPARSTSSSIALTLGWIVLWLTTHQLLLARKLFGNQSAALIAVLAMLVFHLLERSWRVNLFLQSLGGHAPLEKTGLEITATILFTNLPDEVKSWEETDPIRAQAGREAHSQCVGRVVNKHGGRLVDLQGDAQMIAFGLEGGHHQAQAAACALEIVEKVNHLMGNEPSQPSIAFCGLVTGPVAVGQVGGGMYHGVAAIGDTTNSAARLMGKAKESGTPVLASVQTVEALGPRAQAEAMGELSVKGRSETLKVCRLTGFTAPPAPRQSTIARTSRNTPRLVFTGVLLLSLAVSMRLAHLNYFHDQLMDWVTPTSAGYPIVFAGLDDDSLQYQPWPWPRKMHAQIIENCENAGVKAIFLDFLFEDPTDEADDQALIEAVTSHPNVVVGAAARDDGQGLPTDPKLLPELMKSNQWGLVNHAPQNDSESMRYGLWQLPTNEPGVMLPGAAKKICQALSPAVSVESPEDAGFILRWGPRPKTISYRRLLEPRDPIFRELRGKVIVAGDNLPGRSDAFETPFGTFKGAMIHAMAAQTVLTNSLLKDSSSSFATVLAAVILGAGTLWLTWWATGVTAQLLVLLGTVSIGAAMVWLAAKVGLFLGFLPLCMPMVTCLAGWVLSILDTNKALTNYIPRKLQEQLERDGEVADLTTIGTILLTDIRGYTTLSEGRSPSEILGLLNNYHERTASIYESFGGHLITYQGDAQIVVFGPLEKVSNPVLQAVRAAQKLPEVVAQVASEAGLEPDALQVGSGITTGQVTLSLMGAQGQLQYSVFGAPVRRAHHLQSLSAQLHSDIMLDQRSRLQVKYAVKTAEHSDEDGTPVYTVV